MRAELIHASVYILRKRSRERYTKLNRCVRELQRTQRMVEDLVHDLSERVEMLTNTKIDIFAEDENEFDDEGYKSDDTNSDSDQDGDDGEGGADDEKNADGDAKSSIKKKKNERVDDVALNIDPKQHVEDSKADSTGPAAAAKSSDSKDKEQQDDDEKDEQSESKDKISAGMAATSKALTGLASKVFKRDVDKKDKFKESARVIQQFQDELNSTVAELQAERIVRDTNEKNGDDTDEEEKEEEKDDDEDDDDDEQVDQNNPKSNSTSSETQNWKEIGFTREFMKRWQTLNRKNPIDQSWDTLNSNLQKNIQRHEGQDGADDTESEKNDENNKTKKQEGSNSTDSNKNSSGNSTKKKGSKSKWRKFIPFASNRTSDDVQVDEDDYDESDDAEDETLPDLLNLDQINELWEKKDDEWREYLAMNRPEALIKKRIQVEWEDGFESGTITQFNRHTRQHTVQYDDGELRKYDLRRKNYRFLIG